jgi:hypothetical protein
VAARLRGPREDATVEPAPDAAPDHPGPTVWWVNQGQTLPEEMAHGYLSTGVLDSSGRTPWHWETVTRMAPGDITLHVAQRGIRAIGEVLGPPVQEEGPRRPNGDDDGSAGGTGGAASVGGPVVRVPVRYFPLARPILVGTLPETAKAQPPFNRRGNLQQITCCQYPREAARLLVERYRDRWPEGSPFARSAAWSDVGGGQGAGPTGR